MRIPGCPSWRGVQPTLAAQPPLSAHTPFPVQVWVLDALPGEVRSGERGGQDHPADLIAALQQLPMPIPNRSHLQNYLVQRGFSLQVARWASTNLRPLHGDHR